MERIEYKDGMVIVDGRTNAALTKSIVFVSAVHGREIQETCNILNQFLQAFTDTLKPLKEMAEEFKNLFEVLKDICESCISRRTRHGVERAGKPRTSKYSKKWCEKYRPP